VVVRELVNGGNPRAQKLDAAVAHMGDGVIFLSTNTALRRSHSRLAAVRHRCVVDRAIRNLNGACQGVGTPRDSLECFAAFRTIAAFALPVKMLQHRIDSDPAGDLPNLRPAERRELRNS